MSKKDKETGRREVIQFFLCVGAFFLALKLAIVLVKKGVITPADLWNSVDG